MVEVANFMSSHVRQSDVVIRYGGDEFYIYLPHCKGIVAKGICEKIRQEIADKADKALYDAKENGRNQCVVIGK